MSVNTDASLPDDAARRPGRRERRQRRAGRAARPACSERSDGRCLTSTSSWSAPGRPAPARRTHAGPGRSRRRAARAGSVPGVQEHVRRRRLPARARRAHPAVVGRSPDPALGHPPLHHDDDRHPGPHRRLPHRGVGAGRRTTAPPPTGPTGTPGWPARPRPKAPGCSARPPSPACCGTGRGWSASAPTGRRASSRARVVIACDGVNSFLAKEAGLYHVGRSRSLHGRGQGDGGPAEGGHRRALRRAGP